MHIVNLKILMRQIIRNTFIGIACVILFIMHVQFLSSIKISETPLSPYAQESLLESTEESNEKFIKDSFQNISGIYSYSSTLISHYFDSSNSNYRLSKFKKNFNSHFSIAYEIFAGINPSIHSKHNLFFKYDYPFKYSKDYYIYALERLII